MNFEIGTICNILMIISFFCGAFNYIVIRPLNKSIKDLKDSVTTLSDTVKAFEHEKDELDKRVVRVEEKADQHEHRIDILEHLKNF